MPKPKRIEELLLHRIGTEQHFLEIPYLTWWFEYARLEVIEPLTEGVPGARWKEWEQLVGELAESTLELIQQHDDEVEELRGNCIHLQAALEGGEELPKLYSEKANSSFLEELKVTEEKLFGARWPHAKIAYLAQLVINQTPPDCSPLYTIRPLWLRYGDDFLSLRKMEPYRGLVEKSEEIIQRLLKTIGELEVEFSRHLDHYNAA